MEYFKRAIARKATNAVGSSRKQEWEWLRASDVRDHVDVSANRVEVMCVRGLIKGFWYCKVFT